MDKNYTRDEGGSASPSLHALENGTQQLTREELFETYQEILTKYTKLKARHLLHCQPNRQDDFKKEDRSEHEWFGTRGTNSTKDLVIELEKLKSLNRSFAKQTLDLQQQLEEQSLRGQSWFSFSPEKKNSSGTGLIGDRSVGDSWREEMIHLISENERLRETLDETSRHDEQLDTKWKGQLTILQERIAYLEHQLKKPDEEHRPTTQIDDYQSPSIDQYKLIKISNNLETSQKKFTKFEDEMKHVFQLLGQRQQKLKKCLLTLSRQKSLDAHDLDSIKNLLDDVNSILDTWNLKLIDRITDQDLLGIEKSINHLGGELDRVKTESSQLSKEKVHVLERLQEQEIDNSRQEIQMDDMRKELDNLREQLSDYKERADRTIGIPRLFSPPKINKITANSEETTEELQDRKDIECLLKPLDTDNSGATMEFPVLSDKITLEVTCNNESIVTDMLVPDRDWSREMLLRHFYEKNMNELQRKYEDALANVSSCEQYKLAAKEDRKIIQEQLDRVIQERDRLLELNLQYQDSLETTSSNYTGKIQQMSDHICELNERINQLTEQAGKNRSNPSSPAKSRLNR